MIADGTETGRVIRRRRGLYKRSRTGCGTCKRRGKKCDEQWDSLGRCQRCLAGPWDCSGRSDPPKGSTDSATYNPAAAGVSGPTTPSMRLGMAESNSPLTQLRDLAAAAAPLHEILQPAVDTPPVNQVLQAPANQMRTSDTNGISGPQPTIPMSLMAPPGPSPVPAMWNGFAPQDGPTKALFNNAFAQSLFDWSSSGNSVLANELLTDSPLALDFTITSSFDSGFGDPWASIAAATTTPSDSSMTPKPTQSQFGPPIVKKAQSNVRPDRATRRGVSLAEIYARVIESWAVGLPSQKRGGVLKQILNTNDQNDTLRKVRYAVAVAYTYLYGSGPSGHSNPHSRPKLAELARQGSGVVDPGGGLEADEENIVGGVDAAVKRIRNYINRVTIPFASDPETTPWVEDAIRELREVPVTHPNQLPELLMGAVDLQMVECIRGGAAPSYAMIALGDRIVRNAFGHEHPPLCLAKYRSFATLPIRIWAISDIGRCITYRGRRTVFDFYADPTDAESPTSADAANEPWQSANYLGMPDEIIELLARVVNLCADMPLQPAANIALRADEIEAQLRNWVQPPVPGSGQDAAAFVARTIAGEMWRHSALIVLYQSVRHVGVLHAELRRCHAELLSLLSSITQLPNGDLWGFIGLPSFLAAVLSITDEDRKKTLSFMVRAGADRIWLDNIALVEKVWEEMDQTGNSVDWHDKMVKEGLCVAFM